MLIAMEIQTPVYLIIVIVDQTWSALEDQIALENLTPAKMGTANVVRMMNAPKMKFVYLENVMVCYS